MKDNWFENKLGQRLTDESNNLDLNGLWMELENKRAAKKRSLLLPFLGVALFTLFIIGIFLFTTSETKNLSNEQVNSSTPLNDDNFIDKAVASKELTTKIELDSQMKLEKSKSSDNPDITNDYKLKGKQKIKEKGNSVLNTSVLKHDKLPVISKIAEKKADDTPSSTTSNLTHKNTLNERTDGNAYKPTKNSLLIPSPESHEVSYLSLKHIPHIKPNLLNSPISPKELEKDIIPLDNTSNGTSILNWYYGVNFDFGMANRALESTSSITEDIISKRNIDEKMLDQFSGQILLGKKLKNNFFLESGIYLRQYTSKSEFSFIQNNTIQITDTIEINVNPAGDILSIKEGHVVQMQNSTRSIQYYQKYQSIGIPISIGKSWSMSSKMDISVALGAELNLISNDRGNIQSQITPIVAFQNIKEASFYRRYNISGMSNMRIIYNLVNKNKISFGVNYRTDLTSRIKKAGDFNDQFQSLNMQVGWYKGF